MREHAHQLVDRLEAGQLAAVVHLLETFLPDDDGDTQMSKRIVWTEQAKADVRGIEQPVALQILKTVGRYVSTGKGATKQLRGIQPPLIRLRAQITEYSFASMLEA